MVKTPRKGVMQGLYAILFERLLDCINGAVAMAKAHTMEPRKEGLEHEPRVEGCTCSWESDEATS